MTSRHISLKDKLASALCHMLRFNPATELYERIVPYDDAKKMTADQIISLFNFDHGIFHVHGGPAQHWNLTPRLIKEHRKKTAEVDRPAISRAASLREKTADFYTRCMTKPCGQKRKPTGKIRSRGFGARR